MIGVIAHMGREIESDEETCRTLRKQEMVALIRLFCCAEACILAHRPQARTIHSGMNAACERKFAWIAQLIMGVEILQVFFTGQVWHLNMRACDTLLLPLSCFFPGLAGRFLAPLRSAIAILLSRIIVQVTAYLELFGHNSVIPVIIGLAIIVVGILFFLVLRRGATPKK